MEISFNLSHVLKPGSSAGERDAVLGVLRDTLKKIILTTQWDRNYPPTFQIDGAYGTFKLPNVFSRDVAERDNAFALRALLDALTEINRIYLYHRPHTPTLYESGVRYGRTQVWEPIPALYKRGFGDCKSLSAALVAERKQVGQDAKAAFRFMPRKDGNGTNYHILVQSPNRNGWEDPSKVLGMGQNEHAWFR